MPRALMLSLLWMSSVACNGANGLDRQWQVVHVESGAHSSSLAGLGAGVMLSFSDKAVAFGSGRSSASFPADVKKLAEGALIEVERPGKPPLLLKFEQVSSEEAQLSWSVGSQHFTAVLKGAKP